jgi:hypothetical protein
MKGDDPVYELLGSDGTVLVEISAGSAGTAVRLNDRSGKRRLEASLDGSEPAFQLLDDRGTCRFSAVLGEAGPYVALRSTAGHPAMVATGFETRPTIAFFNEDEKAPVIELGCMPEPALILRDDQSVNRLIACVEPSGEVGVRVFDGQSIPRSFIGMEPDNSAALRVMDSVGTTRGYLGAEEAATCRLSLVETSGAVRFEAMLNADGLPQTGMYGLDNGPRIGVRVLPDGTPRSTFFDNSGKPRLVSEVADSGESFMAFLDEKGIKRVQLQQVGRSGDGLYLIAGDDVIRGSFSIVEEQIVISLRDPSGLMRSGIKVDDRGLPLTVLRDSRGKGRIVHQISEAEGPEPMFCVLSEDGETEIVKLKVDETQHAALFLNNYRGEQSVCLDIGVGSPTMSFNSATGDGYILLQVSGDEAKIEANARKIYHGSTST